MEGLTADLIPQPSTTTGTTGSNFNYPSDVTYVSDESMYTGSFVLTHSTFSTSCRSNRNPMSSFSGTGRSRNSIA